jgi:hypothetical protein
VRFRCVSDKSGGLSVELPFLRSSLRTVLCLWVRATVSVTHHTLKISPAQLFSVIRHASRGLLWLLLLNGHLVNGAPAHGTDSLGAVSSESKTCSEIGIELLRRGVSSCWVGRVR